MTEPDLNETIRRARRAEGIELESLIFHGAREVLEALLDNPRLGEQHLNIMLQRKDLSREVVTAIVQNKEWMRSYPLRVAALKHPRLPRHLGLRIMKLIFPFDLLAIVRSPGIAPDLKRLMEDALLAQRESLAIGQRLSLARQGTSRIAGGLLNDADVRVIQAALDNPALTEQLVTAALLSAAATAELTMSALAHPRWSVSRNVKLALIRSPRLSLAKMAAILPELSLADLKDLAEDPRVAPNIRAYVANLAEMRRKRSRRKGV
jgi:hypothetical protein